jgi:hypothetical protein
MADYHPLISRAVEGLGASTGEARRALYERARAALVAQLRAIEPPLSEADITRERLALEDAIRKVEAESARKARTDPRPAAPPRAPPISTRPQFPAAPAMPPRRGRPGVPSGDMPAPSSRVEPARTEPARPEARRAEPPPPEKPAGAANESPRPAAPLTARERLLNARTAPGAARESFRGFRDVVNEVDDLGGASAKAAQSARDTRDSYGTRPPARFEDEDEQSHERIEPLFENDEQLGLDDEAPPLGARQSSEEYEDEEPAPMFRGPQRGKEEHEYNYYPGRGLVEEDEQAGQDRQPRPPRSYRGLAKLAVVLIILAGLGVTISWQWSHITGLYQFISQMRSRPTQTTQAPTAEPKFSGRVPQEQAPGQAPAPGVGTAPGNQAVPAVAQRVVLYEEDSNDPQGKRFVGSAVWRTETVSPGPGLAPELAVRADIEIPERHMTVTWSLRRNTDQALPASHTIEIMFNLPPDFPGGGIANVPGVLMKQSEQARGTPLAGLAVKVTNGFFLIGLSAVDADVQRNIQLLKDRPWFDIPIVYNNGGRAILALEKGPPGDKAFADAFAAWGK